MKEMHMVFESLLLLCITWCIQPAEIQNISPYDRSIKNILLCEKNTEFPNTQKWIDGINTKTVRALACVNTEFRDFISSIRKGIHQLIVTRSDPKADPIVNPLFIICNADGYWCAYGTQKLFPYDSNQLRESIFFGNETSFWYYQINLSHSNQIIRSLKRADQQSVFCIRSSYRGDPNYIIEPASAQIWKISCKNSMNQCHTQFDIGHLEKTFSLIINMRSWLETHCTKIGSSYQRDTITAPDPLSITANHGCKPTEILCTVDLKSPLFPEELWRSMQEVLCSQWHNASCACTTQHIDPRCKEKYERLDALATEENAFDIRKEIRKDFARRHVLHEITNNFSPAMTLYSNPFGEIVIADNRTLRNGSRTFFKINNITDEKVHIQSTDYAVLAAHAQENAEQWIEKEGLLYRSHQHNHADNKELYLFNLFRLTNDRYKYNSVLKVEVSQDYELIDSYAEKEYVSYIYLSMQNQTKSILIRRYRDATMNTYYYSKNCNTLKQVIDHIKDHSEGTSLIFHVNKKIASNAMHCWRYTYPHEHDGKPGFMPYFKALKSKGVDVEQFMNDKHYTEIHQSTLCCYPHTLRERLYAATTVLGNFQLSHKQITRVTSILTCLGTNVALYFSPLCSSVSVFSLTIPWIATYSNLLLKKNISKKQFALYKGAELCGLYVLGRFFSQSGNLYVGISLASLAASALLHTIMPFKAPVKTVWKSWPVQHQWKLMQESEKS